MRRTSVLGMWRHNRPSKQATALESTKLVAACFTRGNVLSCGGSSFGTMAFSLTSSFSSSSSSFSPRGRCKNFFACRRRPWTAMTTKSCSQRAIIAGPSRLSCIQQNPYPFSIREGVASLCHNNLKPSRIKFQKSRSLYTCMNAEHSQVAGSHYQTPYLLSIFGCEAFSHLPRFN